MVGFIIGWCLWSVFHLVSGRWSAVVGGFVLRRLSGRKIKLLHIKLILREPMQNCTLKIPLSWAWSYGSGEHIIHI